MQEVLQSSCFIWKEPWNQSLMTLFWLQVTFENHFQSNWNLFHVDKANWAGGRWVCLWKWSLWRVLFKHEWAPDSREDNTRELIITTEYNNTVVGLKSPSRCCHVRSNKMLHVSVARVVISRIPFSAVFVGFLWMTLGHSVNYMCQISGISTQSTWNLCVPGTTFQGAKWFIQPAVVCLF